MKTFQSILLASVAVIALAAPAFAASTVITKETTTTTTAPIANPVVTTDMHMQTSPVTTTTTITSPVTTTVTTPVTTSTIVTETTSREKPVIPTGTQVVNFNEFDINRDGILSADEVGEMLFKLYDTDGNQVIDNHEYERKAVLTVTPVEKMTVTKYDFNNDGIADQANYTYQTFLKDTQLARFDGNRDGLTPHEFTGMEFLVIDANNDKAVELKEWKGSYIASIRKKNEEANRTNR